MENDYKLILEAIKSNKGFITSAQIATLDIPRRCLTNLVLKGEIYKVDRGIYALPEYWEDELLFLQYRFSKGIYSHETALYLHKMTDRTPINCTMTFPKNYNCSGLKLKNIKARYVSLEIYELGLTTELSPCKNIVKVYDIERTLCDIVKTKHAGDIQIINQAMKDYAISRKRDLEKLMEYATCLGVKSKILNYMEVLL